MIHFDSPIFFLLIPILILFIIYLKFRESKRKQSLINFPQQILVEKVVKSKKLKIYPIINILNYVILFLFVICLAKPQIGNKTSDVLNQGIDIMFALDVSSSMEALDFEPINRIEAAKQVAVDFIKNRKYDRVGLVCFSGLAFTQVPLTNDIDSLIKIVGKVTTRMVSVDGTAIGSAIVTACNRLKESKAKGKVIILITDGANNIGEVDPVTAAEIARDLGIKIYTIGAGSKDGAYYQTFGEDGVKKVKVEDNDLDEETLSEIAYITGGEYFMVNDTKTLKKVMKQIDKIEKTKIEDIKFSTYTELYDKFILILLIIFLLNIFLEHIIFRKII